MLNDDWSLFVRSADFQRVAQVEDLERLETIERHLGLGAWTLTLPFDSPGAQMLRVEHGSGIEVRFQGRAVFSGPMRRLHVVRTPDEHTLTASGTDDMLALQRVVHPQPLTASPPFSASAYDSFSGPASTVLWQFINRNTGPGALTARRWPGLTMAPNPVEGPNIGVSGRWSQTLLDMVEKVGGPHLMSVLIRRVDDGLVCTVRSCRDRTNIEISPRAGTLQGWEIESNAPTMTAGWAGGQGELEAREVVQDDYGVPAEWPLRIERFVDYRNAEDTAELSQSLDAALLEGQATTSLKITPSEGMSARYGVDFDLGDRVTVLLERVRTTETVTTASLRFENGVMTRTFTVGPEQSTGPGALFKQLRQLGSRVRNLEGI